MRARDTARLSALRLLLAALKQREVDERKMLTDADVVAVIEKMLKQRRDSIEQYEAAQRQDLADVEKFEVSVLQTYMPAGAVGRGAAGRRRQGRGRQRRQGPAGHGQGDGRCSSPRWPGAPTWARSRPW